MKFTMSCKTYRMDIAPPSRLCLGLGVDVFDLQTSALIVRAVGGTRYLSIAITAWHPHLHVKLAISRSTQLLRGHV